MSCKPIDVKFSEGKETFVAEFGSEGENLEAQFKDVGVAGASAYEIAVMHGFEGTEDEWLASLQGEDGKNGVDGKDGYTPVKGVDYFDGADGQPGKDGADGQDGYTPVKGVDYFDGIDGKDGYTPVKGVDYFDGADGQPGKDGQDGYTPQKGIDYFDGKDGHDGKNTFQTSRTIVLTVDGWTEASSRRFAQTVAVEGVTTDEKQVIVVDVVLTGSDLMADSEILAAWGNAEGTSPASQNVKQGDGTLTFYCLEVPAVNIPLNVGVG